MGSLLQEEPWVRLYDGQNTKIKEPVWIYEYLLYESGFQHQTRNSFQEHRTRAFLTLIDQNLRLGGDSDFRIVKPKDVMVDMKRQERCYLVTSLIPNSQSLAEYLKLSGAMSYKQVCHVLQQVLQSLQYLHTTYRVHWLQEQSERGLSHANLNLNTLWIRIAEESYDPQIRPFFIYLSRFALWEHLFWPTSHRRRFPHIPSSPHELGTIKKDLSDLGRIAYALLKGIHVNESFQYLEVPTNEEEWIQLHQGSRLRAFILRLTGRGREEAYRSADTALADLRDLIEKSHAPPTKPLKSSIGAKSEQRSANKISRKILFSCIFLSATLIGVIAASIPIFSSDQEASKLSFCKDSACTIEDISRKYPTPSVNYSIQPGASWIGAVSPFFIDTLSKRSSWIFSKESWDLSKKSISNRRVLLNFIRDEKISFLLIQGTAANDKGLTQRTIARDGIVFFTVFSDFHRAGNIPRQLNGQISLEELGRIYSGENDNLLGRHVRLYFPKEESTVHLLRERLLSHKLLKYNNLSEFDKLWEKDKVDALRSRNANEKDTVYNRMLKSFEEQSGVVELGFDRISNVFGQCSVYPLALEHDNEVYPILMEAKNKPVTPGTDLCGDKRGYWINSDVFHSDEYPFSYGLSVVYPSYPKCSKVDRVCTGKVFSDMLSTPEGQHLLTEVGLVPDKSAYDLNRIQWSGE